jgi:hypothetical protein
MLARLLNSDLDSGDSGMKSLNENVEVKYTGKRGPKLKRLKKKRRWTSERALKAVEDVEKGLGISADNLEAWYKVTEAELVRYGGMNLSHHGKRLSLYNLLKSVYPGHKWDASSFVNFALPPETSYVQPSENVFSYNEFIYCSGSSR